MISVGNRDVNNGRGLGFGFAGEMEETELEEGEACSYNNNNNNNNNDDHDPSLDPDIALSYIDEKLQHVLGHFQKDFEGGVSAENLGAKFGGYGSFLPTYQWSPVWSHPRSPTNVQNHNAPPKSPNNLQLENGHHSSAVSAIAPPSLRPGPASSSTSLPALKALSNNDSVKEEISITSSHREEYAARHESVNKRNFPDQKTLKVRIKVGSDNLTQKNAEIYSGLGLNVSPSSSLDESPSESEGLDREPHDAPLESPTSIIWVMTSFPVREGLLLSPLPDYLTHLTKKEKLLKHSRFMPFPKAEMETAAHLLNGSDDRKGDEKIIVGKKRRSVGNNNFSTEFCSVKNGDACDGLGATSNKEVDIDTLVCEDIVTETLKLPLLSNSYSNVHGKTKGTSTADISTVDCMSTMRNTVSSPLQEEPMYTEESGWDENSKAGLTGKIQEDKKESSADDVAVCPMKDSYCKGEKNFDSIKAESNVLVTSKALDPDVLDPLKQKANQKLTSHHLDGKLPPGKDYQSSGVKKKSKGSQSHDSVAADFPKESSKSTCASMSTSKKSFHAENCTSRRETENILLKDIEKVEDKYREFFGDIHSEQEEKKMDLLEIHSEDRPKDCQASDKGVSNLNNALKQRSNGKRTDMFSTSETYSKLVTSSAPPRGPGLVSDASLATTAPVLIEENWVCCDKCQKWRLLPLGTNTDNLPEKWLCSMLNWLPGMNRCSVSEEETTKPLIALYQGLGSETRNNPPINPVDTLSSVSLPDVQHPDQNYRNSGWHAFFHGLKEISGASKDGTPQLLNSKKNIQMSVKSESLNDMYHSPLASELDVRQLSKSSDLSKDKCKNKPKEKHKIPDHNSDGGDTKSLKLKNSRDSDRESFRASKKIKFEDLNVTGDDWMPEHGGAPGKGGPNSSNCFPTTLTGKERSRHNDCSSKDSKSNTKGRQQISAKKQIDKVKISVNDATARKRKINDSHDTQTFLGSIPSTGIGIMGNRNFVEEFSQNDYRKEKKARVSKSEGKESSVSRGSCKSDKKGSHTKNQHLGKDIGNPFFQLSLDGLDNRRDSGSVQASMAATSSSSKVSSSHKNEASILEGKGSPVESVSSSPIRRSTRRNLNGKNESQELGTPRKCPYDEDEGGGYRSGMARKENSTVAQHGSLESSMLHMQDKDFSHLSSGRAKAIVASPGIANHHLTNGAADILRQDTQHSRKLPTVDQSHDEERRNDSRHHANGSRPWKSSKGSSSRSKDKNWSSKSYKVQGHVPSDVAKPRDGGNKFQEKFGSKPNENEKRYVDKNSSGGKLCSETTKRGNRSSAGTHSGPDARVDALGGDATSTPKQSLQRDCNGERSSKGFVSGKTDQLEIVSGRAKSLSLLPSGGSLNETLVRRPRSAHGSDKGNGSDILAADGSQVDGVSKVPKLIRKADHLNGSSRNPTQNGCRDRGPDAPSPARKESSSQAAMNALKEARDLKHMADRRKNSGSNNSESTGIYFQAALKFLHAASLFESSSSENANHGDLLQSITLYSSTAKLCKFCAHEYERSKDMAGAALAYKCMEVAYMRVTYSSHSGASKDRQEFLAALQMAPPGESPSSSASDVDNLNHQTSVDKVALPKGVTSPQVTGNHVIAARYRSNFNRLLDYVQDANFALEASRKSRNAFAAASVSLGEEHKDGISSIKRALDFNFQDIDGFLHLVKLAMEAVSR